MTGMNLDAHNRCDACSAAALHTVTLADGGGLILMCAHHARQHQAALEAAGAVIVPPVASLDELHRTYLLNGH